MSKKVYSRPTVWAVSLEMLGEAYYGAMASSCCARSQRCG